jgi:hypothetical protein
MNHSKIIRGACALPFLLVGSVALAQGGQQPSGSQPSGSGTQSEQLRQQDPLSGSEARTGGSPSGAQQGAQQQPPEQQGAQQQPPEQQGAQQQPMQEPQPQPMQQPGQQSQQQQQPGQQPQGQQPPGQQQGAAAGASFQDLDRDGNGEISRNELRQGTDGIVSEWDVNQDGKVSQLEVARGIYTNADQNGDDSVEQEEFQAVQEKWIPQNVTTSFSEWDGNGDGKLDSLEFADGLVTTEVARKFDQNRDSEVSKRELSNGLLSTLDQDGNNRLDQQEWPMN